MALHLKKIQLLRLKEIMKITNDINGRRFWFGNRLFKWGTGVHSSRFEGKYPYDIKNNKILDMLKE